MRHRIGLAVACLHISAILYLLVAVLFVFFLVDEGLLLAIFFSGFCVALSVAVELIAAGLQRRKFWAYIASMCVFTTYIPSLFLPLGVLGLWGLLDPGSRSVFGVDEKRGTVQSSDRQSESDQKQAQPN